MKVRSLLKFRSSNYWKRNAWFFDCYKGWAEFAVKQCFSKAFYIPKELLKSTKPKCKQKHWVNASYSTFCPSQIWAWTNCNVLGVLPFPAKPISLVCTSLGQKLVTRCGEESRDQRAAGGCVTAQQWADRIKSEMILPEGNKLATLILHALIGSDLCTA